MILEFLSETDLSIADKCEQKRGIPDLSISSPQADKFTEFQGRSISLGVLCYESWYGSVFHSCDFTILMQTSFLIYNTTISWEIFELGQTFVMLVAPFEAFRWSYRRGTNYHGQ